MRIFERWYFGSCWNLRLVIELYHLEGFWFLWKDFLKIIFSHSEIFEFPWFFFAFRYFLMWMARLQWGTHPFLPICQQMDSTYFSQNGFTKVKLDSNSLQVHPQLSHSRHAVDGASTCDAAINRGEQPCMMWIDSEDHQGTLATFRNKPPARNLLSPNWTLAHHIPRWNGPPKWRVWS
jgi:hypothetical protein